MQNPFTPVPAASAAAAPAAYAMAPAGPAGLAAAQEPCTVALVARQAIVNARHEVVGYELFNRSRTGPAHTAATDMALVFATLSHAGSEELVGRQLLFINCTHESLVGGHLELLNPRQVVLEIPPLGHAATQEVALRLPILQSLRQRGFRLAFNQTVLQSPYADWLALADYIKLDLSVLALDHLAVLIGYAQRHSQAQLIAEKVETAHQQGAVADQGVQLFQGYWFSRPVLVQTRVVTPSQGSVLELLHLLRQHAGTPAIEQALKKDAGLAFNLMRLINSVGLGQERDIASFHQAVTVLGSSRLLRWAALLLTSSHSGGAPSVVGHTAVVRGRLMELLALATGEPQEVADQAFVVGIFSLLDTMLAMPLDVALGLLSVTPSARQALLQHQGLLGHLLALAQCCEEGSGAALDQAASALALNAATLNSAHLQALAWAERVAE